MKKGEEEEEEDPMKWSLNEVLSTYISLRFQMQKVCLLSSAEWALFE
jgi:hypothetical protein